MTEFISNREIYERVIRDAVPRARQRLWIATADIKDMYVEMGGYISSVSSLMVDWPISGARI